MTVEGWRLAAAKFPALRSYSILVPMQQNPAWANARGNERTAVQLIN